MVMAVSPDLRAVTKLTIARSNYQSVHSYQLSARRSDFSWRHRTRLLQSNEFDSEDALRLSMKSISPFCMVAIFAALPTRGETLESDLSAHADVDRDRLLKILVLDPEGLSRGIAYGAGRVAANRNASFHPSGAASNALRSAVDRAQRARRRSAHLDFRAATPGRICRQSRLSLTRLAAEPYTSAQSEVEIRSSGQDLF
jgi:hypothetical protein